MCIFCGSVRPVGLIRMQALKKLIQVQLQAFRCIWIRIQAKVVDDQAIKKFIVSYTGSYLLFFS
jgi:hypothetical protein